MKPLPYNTADLLKQSQAMLDQTSAEGEKSFSGSSYEKKLLSSISNPAPAPTPTTAPNIPEPTATKENESFFGSLTGTVDKTRKTLEDAYKEQLSQNQKEQDRVQKNIDSLTDKQEALLESDIEPLLQPFREELENSERKRLYIDENFEANQKLTNELDALLTEGNNLLSLEKDRTIPNVFVNANVNKKMSDISARAGVIQAVMNARSGQIAEAYRMIDRSVSAITADRQDRLSYYETVLNFYESQKDTEGNKLLNLEADEKEFLGQQIALLQNDLVRAQENADYVKNLMRDPESARFMADAGVTLNDTPEQVNAKIAEQSRREEVAGLKNELTSQGYTYVPFPGNRADVKIFEVGGQTLAFVPPPEKASGSGTGVGSSISSSVGALMASDLLGTEDDPFTGVLQATAGGRVLTQSEVEPLTNAQRVVTQLDTLVGSVVAQNTDPIMGIIRSNNPYDVKAQEINAAIIALVPQLARGIYGEVGVLTDTDVERYTRTLPNMKSTEEVNKALTALTLRNVRSAFVAQLEGMAAAGRDVSGYVGLYQRMNEKINKLEKDIGLGEISGEDLDAEFEEFNQPRDSINDNQSYDPSGFSGYKGIVGKLKDFFFGE